MATRSRATQRQGGGVAPGRVAVAQVGQHAGEDGRGPVRASMDGEKGASGPCTARKSVSASVGVESGRRGRGRAARHSLRTRKCPGMPTPSKRTPTRRPTSMVSTASEMGMPTPPVEHLVQERVAGVSVVLVVAPEAELAEQQVEHPGRVEMSLTRPARASSRASWAGDVEVGLGVGGEQQGGLVQRERRPRRAGPER